MHFDPGKKMVYETKLIITSLITTKVEQADDVMQKVEAILMSAANEAKRIIETSSQDLSDNASEIRPIRAEYTCTEGDTPLTRLKQEETRLQNDLTHVMSDIFEMENSPKKAKEKNPLWLTTILEKMEE